MMQENKVPMVDLVSQYKSLQTQIDRGIAKVLQKGHYINGEEVQLFADELAKLLAVQYVIPCANGTDALQIALLALDLKEGDEVIVPAFTYIASVEVIALLGLSPVLVDVNPNTFTLDLDSVSRAISERTRAIIPVHLFGQCADMEGLLELVKGRNIAVIEDNAQALGSVYTFSNGKKAFAGTIGDIGCTSFFPTKNLACYGDGGALYTNDKALEEKVRMIANHGQKRKYEHSLIGCNSRLDTLQASVLRAKLPHLSSFNRKRREVADYYDKALGGVEEIILPQRESFSTQVFHQYTIRVKKDRDGLRNFLEERGVASMIYYPKPIQEQEAYKALVKIRGDLSVSKTLCKEVLSLPIFPEMEEKQQDQVIAAIRDFYGR